MNKRKKPENHTELLDRLTGEAILALGRGDSIRAIISLAVTQTAQWKTDWIEYENAK